VSGVEALARTYVEGWKLADKDLILSCLEPDCVVIESYGPTYRGTEMVARWIDAWHATGNRITRWDITSMHVSGSTCWFEWDFECVHEGQLAGFEGASVATLGTRLLSYLREYAMTAPRYEWTRPEDWR
jgi:ketosteroid isomerase-like protein